MLAAKLQDTQNPRDENSIAATAHSPALSGDHIDCVTFKEMDHLSSEILKLQMKLQDGQKTKIKTVNLRLCCASVKTNDVLENYLHSGAFSSHLDNSEQLEYQAAEYLHLPSIRNTCLCKTNMYYSFLIILEMAR